MTKIKNISSRLLYEQSGSAAIITALFLCVLMVFTAFVMDRGTYYVQAGELQNALDSAALAAARELPANNINSGEWASAKTEAVTYAASNGTTITPENITPIYKNNNSCNIIIGIKITKTSTVNYNFARVIGINSAAVTRTASASLEPVSGVKGAVPLCITAQSLQYAIATGNVSSLTIKCSSSTSYIGIDSLSAQGWFGALDYTGSSGASTYADLLALGFQGSLYIGQVVEMETGNMSGPTLDGFTRRYSQCKDGCTFDNFKPDCPRLCYVPVVQIVDSKHVKIVAFSVFFLESCGGSGNNSYIKATYIKNYIISDTLSGKSGLDFGLYTAKLTD